MIVVIEHEIVSQPALQVMLIKCARSDGDSRWTEGLENALKNGI